MSQVTPAMVKNLRDKTGAGMADCKKALDESNADMEEAISWLRKRGAASAQKRADKSANEGMVVAKTDASNKIACIVEINCETDFVARNQEFVDFVNSIADAVLESNPANEEELWTLSIGDKSLGNLRDEMLSKFSEKIELRRFERVSTDGSVTEYIHAGSKLGVLVELTSPSISDDGKAIARDIAMQIAAMNPLFVNKESAPKDAIEKEVEIYRAKAIAEGKTEDIATRIAEGQLKKFYQENCLIEQSFVKDPSKTVSDVIKQLGDSVNITSFRRYQLGG